MPNSKNDMELINYVKGDATEPQGEGIKVICHIVNDAGFWGAGFTAALAKWPKAENDYRYWSRTGSADRFRLGSSRGTQVEGDIRVCHLVAQHGLRSPKNPKPIDYAALRSALREVRMYAAALKFSIHMPRIGCGLAGGEWDVVEQIILAELCAYGVEVTVYDLA